MELPDDTGVDRHRAQPLSAAQRRRFQMLLHDLWRDQMDQLTDLSVRVHGDDLTDDTRADLDRQLGEVRRALAEIEAALHHLATPTPYEQTSYA